MWTRAESDLVPLVGYTIKAAAKLLGRRASTVRGWAAAGVFGHPDHRKLNGREYRIPADVLSAVADRLRAGDRIVKGAFVRCARSADVFPPEQRMRMMECAPREREGTPTPHRRTFARRELEDPLRRYREYFRTTRDRDTRGRG